MRYFVLQPLGQIAAAEQCFTDQTPRGIATRWSRLATGVAFGDDYHVYAKEITLQLGEEFPGLKFTSFLGNTANMLPVDSRAADVVLAHRVGRTERLPFVLLDHQGKVHSRDYVFLNPLERVACLNVELSDIRRSKKGVIKDVKRLVIDARMEGQLLDLFRLAEEPNVYVFSEALVTTLVEAGCSNFVFTEAPLG